MHLNKFIQPPELSMESIDFQFDEKYIDMLRKELKYVQSQNLELKAMDESKFPEILKEMTGLTIKLETFVGENAYVYHPKSFKNHPFYDDFTRCYTSAGDTKKDISKHGISSYGINLKEGKVYGSVTKHKHVIGLGTHIFGKDSKYTIDEALAVLFHEIGHVMSFYEWAYRMTSTNYLLSEFTKRLLEVDVKDRMTIISEANRQGLCKKVKKELLIAKNADEVRVLTIQSQIEDSRSDLGTNIYDVRGWEMLADQYVVRMGLGASLHTAMKKLGGISTRMDNWIDAISGVIGFFAVSVGFVLYTGVPVLGLIPLLFLAFCPYPPTNGVYDEPLQRIKVIRSQTVARLKAAPDNETKKQILEEIDIMDKAIEGDKHAFSMGLFVQSRFFPNGRARHRAYRTQVLLEDLANSDLNIAITRLEA